MKDTVNAPVTPSACPRPRILLNRLRSSLFALN